MAEVSDLVALYGAVDQALVEHPERRPRVAQLLPLYEDEDLRWFQDFDDWTKERTESEESPFPSVREALEDLADTPSEGRMRARRLLAIAAAVRAMPELAAGDRGLVLRALRGETLTEDDADAERLLQLLEADDPSGEGEDFPDDPDVWWQRLVGASEGVLRDRDGIGHRPCTGQVVEVPLPGGDIPAAALTTVWETSKVDFERALKFLRPVNWPRCSKFWCQMDEVKALPNGVHQYHEVVSIDCAHKAYTWTIEAALDFRFTPLDDVVVTEYQLSDGHPVAGDDVLVDEGSLIVHRIAADKLRITTTKRVAFARYFSAKGLAMLMCALGYASVVEDLVFSCARLQEGGIPLPEGPKPKKKKGGAPDLAPVVDAVSEEVAAAVKDCVDDCVEVVQASSKKMAKGDYRADDLVRDVADTWVRSVRDGAKALDLGVRTARIAARARARAP